MFKSRAPTFWLRVGLKIESRDPYVVQSCYCESTAISRSVSSIESWTICSTLDHGSLAESPQLTTIFIVIDFLKQHRPAPSTFNV